VTGKGQTVSSITKSSVTLNGSPNVTSRVFDTDGKLASITSSGQRTFGYDDAFRITGVTDVADGTKSWTLGYDLLDRLNAATKTALMIGYTYDANGNRLSQTGTSASTYTTSGTSNKLASTSGVLSRGYSYRGRQHDRLWRDCALVQQCPIG
jgi:YD repeat-containing protein